MDRPVTYAAIRVLGPLLIAVGALPGCTSDKGVNVTHANASAAASPELPPLDLSERSALLDRLDSLDRVGGMQAIVQWAKQELQPGRQVRYPSAVGGGTDDIVLADRSIWRLHDDGSVSSEALLPPLTDEQYGESAVFAVLTRPDAEQPFSLRLRRLVARRP
jgi:hypothetical protein